MHIGGAFENFVTRCAAPEAGGQVGETAADVSGSVDGVGKVVSGTPVAGTLVVGTLVAGATVVAGMVIVAEPGPPRSRMLPKGIVGCSDPERLNKTLASAIGRAQQRRNSATSLDAARLRGGSEGMARHATEDGLRLCLAPTRTRHL
ncbi:MAG TPA: hypothetical protein VGS21_03980 [Acidimicrobiales bacterium]|nr:hypothetical protein [Acidimicrobiales bacterium]